MLWSCYLAHQRVWFSSTIESFYGRYGLQNKIVTESFDRFKYSRLASARAEPPVCSVHALRRNPGAMQGRMRRSFPHPRRQKQFAFILLSFFNRPPTYRAEFSKSVGSPSVLQTKTELISTRASSQDTHGSQIWRSYPAPFASGGPVAWPSS
jgi:hypothetical protein